MVLIGVGLAVGLSLELLVPLQLYLCLLETSLGPFSFGTSLDPLIIR